MSVTVMIYEHETWTLKIATERNTSEFEMIYYRKIVQIAYREHVT